MDLSDVFRDRCAVVTGAGSGLGRALAVRLAAAGARLVLVDAVEAAPLRTAEACELDGRSDGLLCRALDVADPDAWRRLAAEVLARTGGADLLFNDAGARDDACATADPFGRVTRAGFLATVHAIETLLPQLATRAVRTGFAAVANVSPPGELGAAAPSSPWRGAGPAPRGLTEGLRAEALAYRSGVGFSSVHPGAVRAGGDPCPAGTCDAVARLVLAGLAERRSRILVPLPVPTSDGRAARARVGAGARRTEDGTRPDAFGETAVLPERAP